jgi:hypothetical protein
MDVDDGARLQVRVVGELRRAVIRDALRHHRPAQLHALVLLKQALGMPVPEPDAGSPGTAPGGASEPAGEQAGEPIEGATCAP